MPTFELVPLKEAMQKTATGKRAQIRQDDKDRLIGLLQAQVVSQGEELDARRREVQELRQLLARGGSLGPSTGTGRLDQASHDSDAVLRDQLHAAFAPSQTKRWWQFWL